MTKLNVSQAARATGKNRTMLYRHMSSGKLSAEKDATDNPVIDVSELQRVYGTVKIDAAPATVKQTVDAAPATVKQTDEKPQSDSRRAEAEFQMLQLKLDHAEQERDAERERRQRAENEAERLLGIVETQTRQLAAPREEVAPTEERKSQRGFWGRLFGQ